MPTSNEEIWEEILPWLQIQRLPINFLITITSPLFAPTDTKAATPTYNNDRFKQSKVLNM